MKKITFKVVFNQFKCESERKPLHIRIYHNGKKSFLPTGYEILPSEWNIKKEEIKDFDIRNKVDAMLIQMRNLANDCRSKNIAPTFEDFRNLFVPTQPQQPKETFTDFCKAELNKQNFSSYSTKNNHRRTLDKLFKMKAIIHFSDVNLDLLQAYEKYMIEKEKLDDNTRGKHHSILRRYINLAIQKDIFTNKNPYNRGFKIPNKETEIIFLTLKEIKRIEELVFDEKETEHLTLSKDLFLFECYTGLRIGDILNLSKTHLTIEGEKVFVNKRMNKTTTFLKNLPYHSLFEGKAVKIIQKYISDTRETIFPKISSKQVLLNIKRIADFAQIDKNLGTHTARHSFCTVMASKVNLSDIQRFTGHKKLETLKKYLHYDCEGMETTFKNVNWNE